ncbi:LPS assembly protein LptD [Sphingomonas sp. HF-S3]|uniref:LPS-assembly protein LptD n=1 Tax=Sphingomonas rustica TaxID=3103142 RepID=A0ABV0B7S2_9SPHN
MTRTALLLSGALPLALCLTSQAHAQNSAPTASPAPAPTSPSSPPDAQQAAPQDQDVPAANLQDRPVEPAPPSPTGTPDDPNQVQFSADLLEYDEGSDTVTASGDVRMYRRSDRLRADKVVWNRKSGQVVAEGNIVIVNPEGDEAYGDRIELTDSLKDGVVDNMLVVLEAGGRIAAERGERNGDIITVRNAAYTPCSVTNSEGCPKEPSWKITAEKVVYDPNKGRLRYTGARVSIFNLLTIPLPVFSHPAGGRSDSGFLMPDVRVTRVNGLQIAAPYFFALAPNRDLTVTPHIFTGVLPMMQAEYRELNSLGAFRIAGYATYSRRSDDLTVPITDATSKNAFRGYIDGNGRYQLDPYWSVSGSIRVASDRTFMRRYDISRDDRLRNNLRVERISDDSYFAINGWAVQTLRVGERQALQPFVLPEIDYRKRFDEGLVGGRVEMQLNTLAIARDEGQDSQRAFASLRWDLRRLTAWGQEITLTAYGRGDAYNTKDSLLTTVERYRGDEGFQFRAVGAVALDMKWPLVGEFLGGTQRITPRVQIVGAPKVSNFNVPNEDARAVDLEDSNLFALNRFPGYDRFEGSSRVTWGVDYALYLPGFSIDANIGQSYRFSSDQLSIFPQGTGLSDQVSDFVGRTVVRFRDFVTFTHRYRLDKDNFAVRRNEIDLTLGSRASYLQLGYLRLNRNIGPELEDLQDREEARVGARVQVARFWSLSGSMLIDLTDRNEDILSESDGFQPVRHRLGVTYEDDCLRLGLTWRRDYQTTGDARRGNGYLLSLSFKNLGR